MYISSPMRDAGTTTLLLQGPIGPLFKGLKSELEQRGDRVIQVVFNGGDQFYADPNAIPFRGRVEEWRTFVTCLLLKHNVDRIVLFGDCRPLHRIAIEVCQKLEVAVWVFEEGYMRPWYLTFERSGVNGFSHLPRDPATYYSQAASAPAHSAPSPYRAVFLRRTINCLFYYLSLTLLRNRYPLYRHHRCDGFVREISRWLLAGVRKFRYAISERSTIGDLKPQGYFLVPLQVGCDSQVRTHSKYRSVQEFIIEVVGSFVIHAAPEHTLVIKHHPMDRGYLDYTRLIAALRSKFRLGNRLRYVHDHSLPQLIHHARGVVGINSTALLSSLQHGVPVKACGRTIMDVPGMVHAGTLHDFWTNVQPVDRELVRGFVSYLLQHTQLNASSASSRSGCRTWRMNAWSGRFAAEPIDAPTLEPVNSPITFVLPDRSSQRSKPIPSLAG